MPRGCARGLGLVTDRKVMMRSLKLAVLLTFSLIASSSSAEEVVYALYESEAGKLFRLNKTTGELCLIEETALRCLHNAIVTLQVGEYYEMSDAKGDEKFLKYLGEGKFETSAWAVQGPLD